MKRLMSMNARQGTYMAAATVCLIVACDLCWAADVFLDTDNGDFNVAASWSDDALPTDDGDFHFIQDSLTGVFTGGSTSVTKLIVSDSTPGTLNMSGGSLIVTGGNESFAIGRSLNGDGVVNLTGTSTLTIPSADSGFIGQRDRGVLNVGPQATVNSGTGDGSIWRIGQFGPVIDAGLEGEGYLNVEGSFSARLVFLGVDDGDGTLRVSGSGSVNISENLVPNVNTFYPNRSATVQMIGSSATLVARGLESENGPAQAKNQYLFQADSGGVSPIKLTDAVNINNNRLTVDLTSYTLAPGGSLVLFDAAPERVFGTFAEVNILGADPASFQVVYDTAPGGAGDILLVRNVPEPSSVLLIGLGIAAAIATKRRS